MRIWHNEIVRLLVDEAIVEFEKINGPPFMTKTVFFGYLLNAFFELTTSDEFYKEQFDRIEIIHRLTDSMLISIKANIPDTMSCMIPPRIVYLPTVLAMWGPLLNLFEFIGRKDQRPKTICFDKCYGYYLDIRIMVIGEVNENNDSQVRYLS